MNTFNKMPAIFVGHGSPENAFENNQFSQAWKKLAASFPKPRSIVVVSAHWTNWVRGEAQETSVAAAANPETIHDFYGFPENFYEFSYEAPGNPELAEKIAAQCQTVPVRINQNWGLDHGAWSVLAQMYPEADIPVLQISLDEELPREKMFALGQELGALRAEGVLILGSGNVVHNLREIVWHGAPFPWAMNFDEFVKDALVKKDYPALIAFEKHPLAKEALPTAEHFLPLLYVIGAAKDEEPQFFCEEIFAASLSMRCVAYGL